MKDRKHYCLWVRAARDCCTWQCHDIKSVIFGSHFVWGKIMAATRQGRGKRHFPRGNRHFLDSAWAVKVFARLTELSLSDVRDTCASSRHFLLAQKKALKAGPP